MDETAINTLLATFVADDTGWNTQVPTSAGLFLGHPIGMVIQTRHVPEDGPPPKPDEQKLALARQVLGSLPAVVAIAEREFVGYAGAEDGASPLVRDPHIWLSLDEFEEDGPGQWSFVIGRQGAPDYGVHVEFDGLEFLERWGGD